MTNIWTITPVEWEQKKILKLKLKLKLKFKKIKTPPQKNHTMTRLWQVKMGEAKGEHH